LPPDGLLPRCGLRAALVLLLLHILFVQNVALDTLARKVSIARGTLRHLRVRFRRVVSVLRLPGRSGAQAAADFVERLAKMDAAALVDLFRSWKEHEPKHSIVGICAR
jgi:hypothetical protein